MNPICDLKAVGIMPENYVCVESSCPLYESAGTKKTDATLSALNLSDLCKGCLTAMNISLDDEAEYLLSVWLKDSGVGQDIPPIPHHLADLLDCAAAEILGPRACEINAVR